MRRYGKCDTRKSRKYIRLIFFGIGLLVASFCPPKIVIAVLAVTVIVLGIIGSK